MVVHRGMEEKLETLFFIGQTCTVLPGIGYVYASTVRILGVFTYTCKHKPCLCNLAAHNPDISIDQGFRISRFKVWRLEFLAGEVI